MNQELTILANLPKKEQGRKIGKPHSLFSVCLLKIASICKGDGASQQDALTAVKSACNSYLWLRDTEIDRQFTRAWQRAAARQSQSLPTSQSNVESKPTSRKPRFMVNELDLTTGLLHTYALLEGKPATKAYQLITDIKNLLQTGELPTGAKYTLHAQNYPQWAIPMWEIRLHFSRTSETLINIIEAVVIHFGGIMEKAYGGTFVLAIPK